MPAGIQRQIFKAYDIRGVVGDGFGADEAYVIGRALGTLFPEAGLTAVGRDGRHSSPSIAAALIGGLNDSGVSTLDAGAVPTPVLYFAAMRHAGHSGLMVTGSHNPPEYNGIKMMISGHTLAGADIRKLHEICAAGSFAAGTGTAQARDVLEDYVAAVAADVHPARPLRIAVDCGNGIAGPAAERLFERLGCQVEFLYSDVDGDFPNHHPNPSIPENLADLIRLVRDKGLDFGLAFDGDGDRLGVVDDRGRIVWADRLMMLFVQAVLAEHPGAAVVYDVKSSSHLKRLVGDCGGRPHLCRTGHSFIKAAIRQTDAVLAGEMSGHLFFNDRWFGFDDGLYAGARFLELVSRRAAACSELCDALPQSVSTPELNVHFAAEDEQHEFMRRFVEEADFGADSVSTVDGLRAEFEDGWGLVRASNTTPCLVLRFESDSESGLERIKSAFKAQLLKTEPTLELPF